MLKSTCTVAFAIIVLIAFTGYTLLVQASSNTAMATVMDEDDDGFVSIFNGKDLTGWTPKLRGEELGEDAKNTFRVIDGTLSVRYDNYDKFDQKFGHIFYETEYSSYILRLEYRFVGEQIEGGPGWAFMNSGVMMHGQDPKTIGKDQDFPNSMEVQLLGQKEGAGKRTTGNLCTPGTHYVQNGKLMKGHCKDSSSETYYGDQWVQLEIEVHGSKKVIHRINGEVVFEYEKPQLNDGTLLEKGTISLQSESHPCDFRNIEIKVLED